MNSDGNLLILKDDTKQIREPNDEEIKLYCKPKGKYSLKSNLTKDNSSLKKTSESSSKTQFNKLPSKNRVREQGIQIKVKKEDEKKSQIDESNVSKKHSEDFTDKNGVNHVKNLEEQAKGICDNTQVSHNNSVEIQILSKNEEEFKIDDGVEKQKNGLKK